MNEDFDPTTHSFPLKRKLAYTHSGVAIVVRTDVQILGVLFKVWGSISHRVSTLHSCSEYGAVTTVAELAPPKSFGLLNQVKLVP